MRFSSGPETLEIGGTEPTRCPYAAWPGMDACTGIAENLYIIPDMFKQGQGQLQAPECTRGKLKLLPVIQFHPRIHSTTV